MASSGSPNPKQRDNFAQHFAALVALVALVVLAVPADHLCLAVPADHLYLLALLLLLLHPYLVLLEDHLRLQHLLALPPQLAPLLHPFHPHLVILQVLEGHLRPQCLLVPLVLMDPVVPAVPLILHLVDPADPVGPVDLVEAPDHKFFGLRWSP
jgi:hypothetical protein